MAQTIIFSKKPRADVKKKPLKYRIKDTFTLFNSSDDKVVSQVMLRIVSKIIIYLLLTLGALITVFPFYWMLATALNPAEKLQAGMPVYFGIDWNFENFINAWNLQVIKVSGNQHINADAAIVQTAGKDLNLGMWFTNTIITVAINTILTVLTTILAAYAIAKLKFVGRSKIFGLLLITMMLPGEILTIQNLVTMNKLGWQNSYAGIIAPFISSVFYIFLLVQLFTSIPDSLYKAARVDGCGDWKFLWRVMVPMSTNTLATVSVLNAIASWNSFLWPSLIVNDPTIQVLSVGLYEYTAAASSTEVYPAPNYVMAASVITILPMFIVYLLLRKQIIAGVSRSGTKG
ncbi:MAG TPA: ABC transporter permease [Firmicutes bacterium]|nr:ABC transporter permease [Bacillota bacterium]